METIAQVKDYLRFYGKGIGEAAFKGDDLCGQIVTFYHAHLQEPESLMNQKCLIGVLKAHIKRNEDRLDLSKCIRVVPHIEKRVKLLKRIKG